MKNVRKLKNLSILALVSLSFVACGGGGSSSLSNITGKVVDGYVQDATVCLDVNNDLSCNAEEPTSITDGNGRYSLLLSEIQKNSGANIIAYGGKDIDTQAPFLSLLKSPILDDTTNITPITSILAAGLDNGVSLENTITQLRILFDIKDNIDIWADPVAIAKENTNDTKKFFGNNLAITGAINVLLSADTNNINQTNRFSSVNDIYKSFAIRMNYGIDKGVSDLINNAAYSSINMTKIQNTASAIAERIYIETDSSDISLDFTLKMQSKMESITNYIISKIKEADFSSVVDFKIDVDSFDFGTVDIDSTILKNKNVKTITLIHMNDFHANLMPHNEQYRNISDPTKIVVKKMGGLARIKTKIDSIRDNTDLNTSILMNIGDTYHGSAEALYTNGNMIVELVNRLGIDVGVIGNWDYAYGPIVTNARFGKLADEKDSTPLKSYFNNIVKRPNFDVIAANAECSLFEGLTALADGNLTKIGVFKNIIGGSFKCPVGSKFLPSSKIIDKNGIKVGFIGLTSDIVDMMSQLLGFNIDFTQGKENYINLIKTESDNLKTAGADIIIVMSELGLQKDNAIAESMDRGDIDFIFSGHTHELTRNPIVKPNGIVVVESGNDCYLGEMKVQLDNNKSIISSNWKIHDIDSDVLEDSDMKEAIAKAREPMLLENPDLSIPQVKYPRNESMFPDESTDLMYQIFNVKASKIQQKLQYSLDKKLGHTSLLLDRRDALESSLNNAVTDLLRNEYNTDISMAAGFRYDSTIVEDGHIENGIHYSHENDAFLGGDIHVADVYRFFPVPNHIAKGNITGLKLKETIEENLQKVFSPDVFKQEGGWFNGFSGLSIHVDLTKPDGSKLVSVRRSDGGLIEDDENLTAVSCARVADPFPQFSSQLLCGYQKFTGVTKEVEDDQNVSLSGFFIEQVLSGKLDTITSRNSVIEDNGKVFWPITPLYQPLKGI